MKPDTPLKTENSRVYRFPSASLPALPRNMGTFVLMCVMLAGCNLLPLSQSYAAPESPPNASDQSQLMYEIMIAELAGRRGMLDVATEGYFSASKRTDDPRVSERATRLAVWSRAWQQAEEAGKRWATLDPENPEARQLLCQIYLRQGDSGAAANELAALISMTEPQDSLRETMQSIFTLLVREPNRDVAMAAMTDLRDRYAEDTWANLALAQLASNAKQKDVALAAVDRSIALDSRNSEARLLRAQILSATGNVDAGLAELAVAADADPDNIDLHLGYARLLIETGRYQQAADELDAIFTLSQDNAGVLFTIGLLALESKRTVAAERYFARLLALDEYTAEAHYYLGRIADNRVDYPTAIEHYESVVSGNNFLEAQIRAAVLYGASGRVEIGRKRLQQLSMENPDPELKPRLIRADGKILLEAGDVAGALKVLSAGVEQFPEDSDVRYARALAAENAGDTELFLADLRQMIKIDPDNAHAMNALGYYYAEQNSNLDEAKMYLEKASGLLPKDPAIMDSLGWLRYRTGDYNEALELLRRAYQILQDPEIAAHLGEVLWVTGEQASARDVWTRALKDAPDDENLLNVMDRFIR